MGESGGWGRGVVGHTSSQAPPLLTRSLPLSLARPWLCCCVSTDGQPGDPGVLRAAGRRRGRLRPETQSTGWVAPPLHLPPTLPPPVSLHLLPLLNLSLLSSSICPSLPLSLPTPPLPPLIGSGLCATPNLSSRRLTCFYGESSGGGVKGHRCSPCKRKTRTNRTRTMWM